MPTAKLWWNGSSWVKTANTNCASESSKNGAAWGLKAQVRLIAYDDMTIKLYASVQPDGLIGSGNEFSRAFTASYAGISISVSNGSRSGTEDLRSATSSATSTGTGTVSWTTPEPYGLTGAAYPGGSAQPLHYTGSSTVGTSPFLTVTYKKNDTAEGVESDTFQTQTILTKYTYNLLATAPSRAGWTFLGWSTDEDATSASYQPSASMSATQSNVTLFAVWARNIKITAPEGVTITLGTHSVNNDEQTFQYPVGTYDLTFVPDPGFIVKSRSPSALFNQIVVTREKMSPNVFPSATSQRVGCHVYDGTSWRQAVIYAYDGERWRMCQAYAYDGTSWKLLY